MRSLFAALIVCLALPATAAPPQKADVVALVTAWQDAQNKNDLDAYMALYDAKFVGVKRTSDGSQKTYTRDEWRADRGKMFKAGTQKVAAEQVKVETAGDGAIVWFVQRWQGKSYADHGDKKLTLSSAGGALKIVREELLFSAPGWTDDPKTEVDATTLVSPITVRVRAVGKVQPGMCGGVTYTLELKDAKGKVLKQEIGTGFVNVDAPVWLEEPQIGSDPVFKFGEWCAGGADYYEIRKSGDALVVRYEGADESDAPVAWEPRLTVKLPSGAKLK